MVRFNYPYYPFQWYKNGNPASGSAGAFNYKVQRAGDQLQAFCWLGPWCMENTRQVDSAQFPFGEEGLRQAESWLKERFDRVSREVLEAPLDVLGAEPWSPPEKEEEEDEAPF